MNVVCLDMEGVLVPEIWIAFAKASGIPELTRTTRDEPDYDKLMRWRLGILKDHGLGLREIQATIAKIDPLPGAKTFLDELRSLTQVILQLSHTIVQPVHNLYYKNTPCPCYIVHEHYLVQPICETTCLLVHSLSDRHTIIPNRIALPHHPILL